MTKPRSWLRLLWHRSEAGASAVEYGLLVAGIAAVIAVVVFAFGDNLRDVFDSTCSSVAVDTACNAN